MLQADLPPEIIQFVEDSTGNYGKVKLVLQRNKYFVESPHTAVLEQLLQVSKLQLQPVLAAAVPKCSPVGLEAFYSCRTRPSRKPESWMTAVPLEWRQHCRKPCMLTFLTCPLRRELAAPYRCACLPAVQGAV